MYIKNRSGPKIEPCGTTYSMPVNDDFCLRENTNCSGRQVVAMHFQIDHVIASYFDFHRENCDCVFCLLPSE